MRLLVTGASGLLGLNLALEAARTHEVIGLDRNTLASAPFKIIRTELLDVGAFERALDEAKPDAVIHCAALADVDACEQNPDLARRTNAELPARIAQVCAQYRTQLVHISTDAVFDGKKDGSYSEADEPHPGGVYAATKYEGEKATLRVNPDACVTRVNFYGWSLTGKRSLAEFFVNHLSNGTVVNGFTDVVFCPMLVSHLSEILMQMLKHGLHGLYHAVGPQAMTKYQFGIEIARRFGFRENLIAPQSVEASKLAARRSHNLWLSTHKLSTDLQLSLPDFSIGLARFYEQYQQSYPQKIRSYAQVEKVENRE